MEAKGPNTIYSITEKLDEFLIICATESGLQVYIYFPDNLDQPTLLLHHFARRRSVVIGDVLYGNRIAALVAGGTRPKYGPEVVEIRDKQKDYYHKTILSFDSHVLNVKFYTKKMIVVVPREIHIFSCCPFALKKLHVVSCHSAPRGLMALPPIVTHHMLLAYAGEQDGTVDLLDLKNIDFNKTSGPERSIKAHQSQLACLALNYNGTMLATCSLTGTLVRLWDTQTGNMLYEFRRGYTSANITGLSFSYASDFLAASTDHGIMHVFAVKNPQLNKGLLGTHGSLIFGGLGGVWPLVDLEIPTNCGHTIYFEHYNKILVSCYDGNLHRYVFREDGLGKRQFGWRFQNENSKKAERK